VEIPAPAVDELPMTKKKKPPAQYTERTCTIYTQVAWAASPAFSSGVWRSGQAGFTGRLPKLQVGHAQVSYRFLTTFVPIPLYTLDSKGSWTQRPELHTRDGKAGPRRELNRRQFRRAIHRPGFLTGVTRPCSPGALVGRPATEG